MHVPSAYWILRIKNASISNVRLQITANRTPLTRNRGGGGMVITTASNPWRDRRSRARVRILARRFSEFRAAKNRFYLRRVDFLCMNIDWNFDEKASILASFLLLLPSACWFFRIKNYVNFMYVVFEKLNKTTKINANPYFIFRSFGDGENRPRWFLK